MDADINNYKKINNKALYVEKIVGLHPMEPINMLKLLYCVFNLATMTYLTIVFIIEEKINLKVFSKLLESGNLTCIVWLKLFSILFKRKQMQQLIQKMDQFWQSKSQEDQIKQIERLENGFIIIGSLATSAFIVRPFITSELTIFCYVPEQIPFQLFKIFNSSTIVIYLLIALGVDLYASTTLLLLSVQFKILAAKIRAINYKDIKTVDDSVLCQNEIRACVQHHNFLFRYLDTFNEFNNINMLVQMFLIEAFMCSQLIIIAKNPYDIMEVPKSIIGLIIIAVDMTVLYTWPASKLTEAAADIKSAIYESDWINCNSISLRKQLIILMQRTQDDAKVTGGKFFIIDIPTSTMVFKAAYTFFAYLNTLG